MILLGAIHHQWSNRQVLIRRYCCAKSISYTATVNYNLVRQVFTTGSDPDVLHRIEAESGRFRAARYHDGRSDCEQSPSRPVVRERPGDAR